MEGEERPRPPIGTWLRRRREELELSRAQVSVKVGGRVSGDYLRKIEAGERAPSHRILRELAPIYRVDPLWLLREAGIAPGAEVAEPAPVSYAHVDTWAQIEAAIRRDRDLDGQAKRSLLRVLEPLVRAYLDRARHGPASG